MRSRLRGFWRPYERSATILNETESICSIIRPLCKVTVSVVLTLMLACSDSMSTQSRDNISSTSGVEQGGSLFGGTTAGEATSATTAGMIFDLIAGAVAGEVAGGGGLKWRFNRRLKSRNDSW